MSVCGQPCAFISARFVFRKRCREISILSPGVNSIAEVTYDAADCKEIYVKKDNGGRNKIQLYSRYFSQNLHFGRY